MKTKLKTESTNHKKTKMITAACLLASLISATATTTSFADNRDRGGNGGDGLAIEFKEMASKGIDIIAKNPSRFPQIDISDLKTIHQNAIIESTDQKLYDHMNAERDAINQDNKITFNRFRWSGLSDDLKIKLSLHEYFGLLGLEGSENYSISSQVVSQNDEFGFNSIGLLGFIDSTHLSSLGKKGGVGSATNYKFSLNDALFLRFSDKRCKAGAQIRVSPLMLVGGSVLNYTFKPDGGSRSSTSTLRALQAASFSFNDSNESNIMDISSSCSTIVLRVEAFSSTCSESYSFTGEKTNTDSDYFWGDVHLYFYII